MNVKNLDLNLLKIFEIIFLEKSLTRAASEMSLSQPAISHSLAKLRDFFDDPLFVRNGNFMVPTKRSEAIYEDVRTALKMIQKVLDNKGNTSPAESSRAFNIGMSNYCSITILPELLAALSAKAPSIRVITKHVTQKQKIRLLENGDLDLVIGSKSDHRTSLKQQKLFSDEDVCISGSSTSLKEGPIDIENLCLYPLIRHQISNQEKMDIFQKLDEINGNLNTPIITDQELVIPQIVSKTDVIGVVGNQIALKFKDIYNLKITPINDGNTQFDIFQYWHMRYDNDPVHGWFRKLVKKVCQRISQ